MADLSDIENVLVATLTQTIYPTGTGQPSIVNAPCKIYRGWPVPAELDKDLAAGKVNISVFPQDNEQRTTRYPKKWQELPVAKPALTLTVSGDTITVGGTPSSPLNAAVIISRAAYVYPVQPNDTLVTIASGLAAVINTGTPATSSGAVITVPGASTPMHLSMSVPFNERFGGILLDGMAGFWPVPSVGICARVGAVGSVIREIKRQKRGFQITFWCPTPVLRDAIAPPCDVVLGDIDFLALPDGTAGRLLYERTKVSDRSERENLYRRDLFYSVEYGTTETQSAAQVVAQLFKITGGLDPSAPVIETFAI